MFDLTESRLKECQRLFASGNSGRMAPRLAGERILALCPEFSGAYLLLSNACRSAGDDAGSETWLWKGAEHTPSEAYLYFMLAGHPREADATQHWYRGLIEIACWRLAAQDDISAEVTEFFQDREGAPALDYSDPASYASLAAGMQREREQQSDPPEIAERLLPFQLLAELEYQAPRAVDPQLLRQIRENGARCAPLFHASLRERALLLHGDLKIRALLMAILGEIGAAELVPELLELALRRKSDEFLHAQWAIWRLAARFPEAALKEFRAAIPRANPTMRCAIAEQIALLPETPGADAVLVDLLDGFAKFARSDDAPYLLLAVGHLLLGYDRERKANELLEQCRPLLPREGRERVSQSLDAGAYVPRLHDLGIPQLDIEDVCLKRTLMAGEREEIEPEEPVRRESVRAPVRPGRNEPCWCGSGKKYKKCHLAADQETSRVAEPAAAHPPAAVLPPDPVAAKLVSELVSGATREDMMEASGLFFGRDLDPLESEGAAASGFTPWFIYDYRSSATGRTRIEDLIERRGKSLTVRERRMLAAWRQARFGLFEVQSVEEGRGVELKDLSTGARSFVHQVTSSLTLVRWDCLLNRIYEFEGRWESLGDGMLVPREVVADLQAWIEHERKRTRLGAGEFVRANSHRLHRRVRELHEKRIKAPEMRNAEGDRIEFGHADYKILDVEAVFKALRALDELEENPAATGFVWLETGADPPRRAYGRIEMREGKLRLECDSRERLERGRKLIERHAGEWLRHVGDSFRKESELPPAIEPELIRELKAEHYARWLDDPLPALAGRTPREAVRTAAGREQVEDLLRGIENAEERGRKQGEAAYDFSQLRAALGLGEE